MRSRRVQIVTLHACNARQIKFFTEIDGRFEFLETRTSIRGREHVGMIGVLLKWVDRRRHRHHQY